MSSTITPQQQTVADRPSDWSQPLPFAQFDPASGTLDGIGVTLSGDVLGSVSIESLEAAPSTVTASLDGTVTVTSPTGVLMAQVSPDAFASASLAAGASTTLSLAGTATTQALFQPGSIDLGNFIGTGSVPLTAGATSQIDVTGPANMEIESQATAGATVTLQYDYTAGGSQNSSSSGSGTTSITGNLTSLPAGAVTTTPQTVSVADQTTGWTNDVTFQSFNPALGQLEAVNITLTADAAASVAAENEDAAAATVSTAQTATVTLDIAYSGKTVTAAPTIADSLSLGGYDGAADFAGTSGRIDQNLTHTATSTVMLTDASDLLLFGNSDTVTLPVSTIGTSILDGPGNLLARLLAQAGATVSVSYAYVPWTQVTWTNTAGGNWNTGSNWSSNPTAANYADIAMVSLLGAYSVIVSGSDYAKSLQVTDPNATVAVTSAAYLAIGQLINTGMVAVAGNLEVYDVADSFQNTGTLSLTAGSYVNFDGDVAVGDLGTIFNAGSQLNFSTLDNTGDTLSLNAAGYIILPDGAAIASAGEIEGGTVIAQPDGASRGGSLVGVLFEGPLDIDSDYGIAIAQGTRFESLDGGRESR